MAKKTTTNKPKEPIVKPAGDPPVCPNGYYWNGSMCVKNVGG